MLAPIVCCARVPQNGCNVDFVIDCGGTGGTCGIVHNDVLCYSVHVCAFATVPTNVVMVQGSQPSWLGACLKTSNFVKREDGGDPKQLIKSDEPNMHAQYRSYRTVRYRPVGFLLICTIP